MPRGIFASLLALDRRSRLTPGTSLANPAAWLMNWGGAETAAGIRIDEYSALNNSAVFQATRFISQNIASLPLMVYERLDRGKRPMPEHPLYRVLHSRGNRLMTAMTVRETLQAHALTWGNGYAEIERNRNGEIIGLWPIAPDRVRLELKDTQKRFFVTRKDKPEAEVPQSRMFHLPGMGFDGLQGYSVITMARESLGLIAAAERYGAKFFRNGARASGVAEHPGQLTDKAHENLRRTINQQIQGENVLGVLIFEEGMKWQQISIPPEEAQYLESRRFGIEEVARWFDLPPHVLKDLNRSTNNNIEHQGIEVVVYSLRPWCVRWEQAIAMQLMTEAEQQTMLAEHKIEGLLRGDSESRAKFYTSMFNVGGFSINDMRELENLNPIEGGDKHFVPLNMVPVDMVEDFIQAKIDSSNAKTALPADPGRLQPLAADAFARILRREEADVMREAARRAKTGDFGGFEAWLEAFYAEHRDFAEKTLRPVLECLGGSSVEVNDEALRHCDESQRGLLGALAAALAAGTDASEALQAVFRGWAQRPLQASADLLRRGETDVQEG